ncbi:MAG: peptide/nickel transport system substrate-binding protein [Microbacteriaceae bacterium]|jgi:peptide/nickel transport system substrate-binding protein|nr:peptide/nickel transport system substrate-binding protein [Microbacteriaceae bacterium]
MKRKIVMGVAAAATVVLMFAGCASGSNAGNSAPSVGKPQSGGDLVMARAAEPTSLLPWTPTDNASIWTLEEIYDTLLVPTQDGKSVKSSLATTYKESADKLSWTFDLRHGVKFSNGQELTSADVKFSLDQSRQPNTPFYFIDKIISSIDTPDKYTVVIHTSSPWSPLPADMALYANSIVPNNYAGMSASAFAEKPIGTGPFKLSSWVKGQSLKLVKNSSYWQQKKPYLNSVTFTVVPDSNTRATQIQSNQAQINEFPAYSSISALQSSSTEQVGLFPSSRVDYFVMNNKQTPFDDPNVRLAVAQAVDRKSLIKAVLFGHGTVPHGYMSPALWAYDSSINPPTFNLSAAKATLAKSSHPNGFSTKLLVYSGDVEQEAAAQLIQGSLAKIGIKVTLQTLDPSAAYQAEQTGNYEMGFSYETTDIIDPDEIIRFAGLNTGGSNAMFTSYQNPQLEALADKADTLSSQGDRYKVYSQIQQAINAANPYVLLYYSPSVYSYSNNVHDFHPYPTGNYNLVDTWMSK